MRRVLILGDLIRDSYRFIKVERTAQEAPIPIWDVERSEDRLGGCGNVVNNFHSLVGKDVEVFAAGIADRQTIGLLDQMGVDTRLCVLVPPELAIVKERYVGESNTYLARVDNRRRFLDRDIESFQAHFRTMVSSPRIDFDALIVSDYDKGSVNASILDQVRSIPIRIVDSKRLDLRIFSGFSVLKLNIDEYSKQVSSRLYGNSSIEEFFEYCVVTQGHLPTLLKQFDRFRSRLISSSFSSTMYIVHSEEFPVKSMGDSFIDVTGCGDTHTAALAKVLVDGGEIRSAISFANMCSSSVACKFGTSRCDSREVS